jgi:putative transposase
MSRKGNCWDNAVAEGFRKTVKTEMVYHENFTTGVQDKLVIFEYVEVWYNRKTRHSTLNPKFSLVFSSGKVNKV